MEASEHAVEQEAGRLKRIIGPVLMAVCVFGFLADYPAISMIVLVHVMWTSFLLAIHDVVCLVRLVIKSEWEWRYLFMHFWGISVFLLVAVFAPYDWLGDVGS
ncbi:MAG: hypothetical protein Alpg2KO_09520 [Alphaproteobacteria bacterium]